MSLLRAPQAPPRSLDRRQRVLVGAAMIAPLVVGAALAVRHRAVPPTFPEPTLVLAEPLGDVANHGERARRERRHAEEARSLLGTDPASALARAREGDALYPGGAATAFRQATVIRALVRLERKGEAEEEARRFLARFPDDLEAEDIAALAGLTPEGGSVVRR